MVDARALEDALVDVDAARHRVVLMPDFSVDHLMHWESLADAVRVLRALEAGGNVDVHVPRQALRVGGGAANTAHAVARFGMRAHLVAASDAAGKRFAEATLGADGVDLSRLREDDRLRVTGAIECGDASLMLETPSDVTPFGPQHLRDADHALVDAADAVYVGHWPNPHADALASTVWARAKQAGAWTCTDAGGPLDDADERARRRAALASPHLDAVSVNGQEVVALAETGGDPADADALREAGCALSRTLTARVDVHCRPEAMSFQRGRLVASARMLDADVHQATGAGDTWTAGVLLGDVLGLDAEARLLLANVLVAAYLASPDARPPTLADVRARVTELSAS